MTRVALQRGQFLKTRMMITHSFYPTECDYLSIKQLNTPPAFTQMKCFPLLRNRKISWRSCATLFTYLSTSDSLAPSRRFIQLIREFKQGRRQRQRQRQKTMIGLVKRRKVIRLHVQSHALARTFGTLGFFAK